MATRRVISAFVSLFVVGATQTIALGQPQSLDQQLLERGGYLVNAVMACDGCHSPRGPKGYDFDVSRRFAGGYQVWDTPAYRVRGSNISSDRETGIGTWSVEDIKRLLVEGVRPNGMPVVHQMPYPFYKILTERDLTAVATYVKSAASVRNDVPAPIYRSAHPQPLLIPGAEKPFTEDMLNEPIKRGFYLATIAHCMECHSRTPDGKQDYVNWWGRGGAVFKSPKGQVKAANITSHKNAGIGSWTDNEIKRSLTHGEGRDGRALGLQMQRQVYFSKLTTNDLDALVAWLRSLPPLE